MVAWQELKYYGDSENIGENNNYARYEHWKWALSFLNRQPLTDIRLNTPQHPSPFYTPRHHDWKYYTPQSGALEPRLHKHGLDKLISCAPTTLLDSVDSFEDFLVAGLLSRSHKWDGQWPGRCDPYVTPAIKQFGHYKMSRKWDIIFIDGLYLLCGLEKYKKMRFMFWGTV